MIKLTLPVSEDVVRKLKTGDEVYLDGDLVTGRDRVHERVVKDKIFPSVSLKDGAIFHAGPIVAGDGQTGYTTLAVGPTTSMRMEKLEADFIRATGVRIIIGKGGMGAATAEACKKYGAVHLMFAGGAAVLAASEVVETSGAEWTDRGMDGSRDARSDVAYARQELRTADSYNRRRRRQYVRTQQETFCRVEGRGFKQIFFGMKEKHMDALQCLYSRVSTRDFNDKPVSSADVAEIVRAAGAAPVGMCRYADKLFQSRYR